MNCFIAFSDSISLIYCIILSFLIIPIYSSISFHILKQLEQRIRICLVEVYHFILSILKRISMHPTIHSQLKVMTCFLTFLTVTLFFVIIISLLSTILIFSVLIIFLLMKQLFFCQVYSFA